VKPGGKGGITTKERNFAKSGAKDLLSKVKGIILIPEKANRKIINALLVKGNQGVKGIEVALLTALNQALFHGRILFSSSRHITYASREIVKPRGLPNPAVTSALAESATAKMICS